MKAIVAVDNFWGIGKNNDLLFHIPIDMQHFKNNTTNKIVVMGSNTLKSFPNSKPLPKRINIVLFPGGEKRDDCIVVDSLESLREELRKYDTNNVFIIGGAMFYRTMLPFCSEILVTKVDANGDATVFYENLDKLSNWECTEISEPIVDNGLTLRFCAYKNNEIKEF
ncbi:MAG: dihydrofolate reductase [Clostridia bacterium]